MADLYKSIGQKTEKNLLADPQGAEKIVVPLLPGKGELSAGTLLYRNSAGYWEPAATAQVSTSYELAVLAEDVDTGNGAAVAEDGIAYRAGRFVYENVVYYNTSGSKYDNVTAAMKLALRLEGIKFDKTTLDEEFDNGTYKITYVANNSVTPAEDDVVVEAQSGSTYTVLNNSDASLSFTAPNTKSFSKWNTKADGSGTDYAAAATYSVTADLKLYAVWA